MHSKTPLYCFDFDGTLTTHDTLLAFIAYVHGRRRLLATLLRYSPLLVLMRLRLYPNWNVKQRVFSSLFRGMPYDTFLRHCQSFAQTHQHLLRPEGMRYLRRVLSHGHSVYIISASIDDWVRPFFTPIPASQPVTILGTRVQVTDGLVTGRFLTPNCYGAEKVKRLTAVLPLPRDYYHITAFGDSRGDKDLLSYADESFYKPFR